MDLVTFRRLLAADAPPAGAGLSLRALWHAAKGDWNEAHRLAQRDKGEAGAWVHAHLHRIEGDEANAGYWYRRAGKEPASVPLEREWEEIVQALCEDRT